MRLPIKQILELMSIVFANINLIYWLAGEFYWLGKYSIVSD